MLGLQSQNPEGLANIFERDAACDAMKQSILSKEADYQLAHGVFQGLQAELSIVPPIIALIMSIKSGGALANAAIIAELTEFSTLAIPSIAAILAAGGGVFLAAALTIAACESFNTCNGPPASLITFGEVLNSKAAPRASLVILGKVVSRIDLAVPGAVAALLYTPVYAAFEKMLLAAEGNYEAAYACCGGDCSSAVCQEASLGCLLSWGSFFSGDKLSLNCGAT